MTMLEMHWQRIRKLLDKAHETGMFNPLLMGY